MSSFHPTKALKLLMSSSDWEPPRVSLRSEMWLFVTSFFHVIPKHPCQECTPRTACVLSTGSSCIFSCASITWWSLFERKSPRGRRRQVQVEKWYSHIDMWWCWRISLLLFFFSWEKKVRGDITAEWMTSKPRSKDGGCPPCSPCWLLLKISWYLLYKM